MEKKKFVAHGAARNGDLWYMTILIITIHEWCMRHRHISTFVFLDS